jgi:hypothetical protein
MSAPRLEGKRKKKKKKSGLLRGETTVQCLFLATEKNCYNGRHNIKGDTY